MTQGVYAREPAIDRILPLPQDLQVRPVLHPEVHQDDYVTEFFLKIKSHKKLYSIFMVISDRIEEGFFFLFAHSNQSLSVQKPRLI